MHSHTDFRKSLLYTQMCSVHHHVNKVCFYSYYMSYYRNIHKLLLHIQTYIFRLVNICYLNNSNCILYYTYTHNIRQHTHGCIYHILNHRNHCGSSCYTVVCTMYHNILVDTL
ncbi:hypothetical protein MHBO_004790 [Bonamia ostreae]|uniref:Uncharacterized protein n=1 Tax=Bonamia ostreae TaxID=126728 RepID=A0ABV2AU98_9EUKA